MKLTENKKLKIAKKNILRDSYNPKEFTAIKGYDFNNKLDYNKLLDSFSTTGFQASNLGKAIKIIKKMREEKCIIFLGYTSNMVTSGLRDIFRYLAEHKLVDVIVTTAGGVEEDLIKCYEPFILGSFDADGKELREKGINRTGNIFVPNERYVKFEKFFIPFLEEINKENKTYSVSELINKMGERINNKESIYYWCNKNNIPVFCPAFTDGSMGDMIYFFKYKHPELKIDITDDIKKLNDIAITAEKTGIIILGSGIIKHHICNANMFRNGAEYAVYINNAQEFDGSDSGAKPEEAISWGKILPEAKHVKIFGDATIIFPLIAAKCFVD
ncbi:MAG TPA: deoxyhypusine synthase [Candidatus Nanoarchaeia archaeon]|nr:deoxyhypusine synthase [Candidatus Nanoarchaeia archaeon]